jgi:cell wall-associated NlpC family hydrolase
MLRAAPSAVEGRPHLFPPLAGTDTRSDMTPHAAKWSALGAVVLAAGLSACASHRPTPVILPPSGTVSGTAVVRTAESLLGTPYRLGGTLPDGFDCSGLVCYVFARHGVAVPRDVKQQAAVGRRVARTDVRAGDLVFFATTGPGPTHVAIAIDGDRFIHAPRSGAVVRIESLRSTYWSKRFLFGRRLTR